MRVAGSTLHIPKMDETAPTWEKIGSTYNTAADSYDLVPLGFRDVIGRATIARTLLRQGHHVLDVGCGSGAATLPAAEAVGADGRVLGVDLAAGLLDLARTKAAQAKLGQIEFVEGSFESLDEPSENFQTVVCSLGMFGHPEPKAGVKRMWRWVRPSGNLAFTTWGARPLEPLAEIFWRHVRAVRPSLAPAAGPWDAINTPAAVMALFRGAGISSVIVEASAGEQRLRTADDGWTILMGTWHRAAIDSLEVAQLAQVHAGVLAELDARGISRVEVNVIYALARKP